MERKLLETAKKTLDALHHAIKWEGLQFNYLKNKDYISIINNYASTTIQDCSNCGGVMQKIHDDFCSRLWKDLLQIDTNFVPSLPVFKTGKYLSKMWQDSLLICSFRVLKQQRDDAISEAKRYRRVKNNMLADAFEYDSKMLMEYYKTKMSYFDKYLVDIKQPKEKKETSPTKVKLEQKKKIAKLNLEYTDENVKTLYKTHGFNVTEIALHYKKQVSDIKKVLLTGEEYVNINDIKQSELTRKNELQIKRTPREEVFYQYMLLGDYEKVAKELSITVYDVENSIIDVLTGDIDGSNVYPKPFKYK